MLPCTSYPPPPPPPAAPVKQVAVLSQCFCLGYSIDLTISRKLKILADGNFGVADANGNIMFEVRSKSLSLHDRRVLLDAAGNPLITFQQKLRSAHRRWQAFRGASTDERDLVFSVRKSSILQLKTKPDVFLAYNTREEFCDFKIEGSWFEKTCVIYTGKTNNVIAHTQRKYLAQSDPLGKETFGVTVCPNVDYAFIVALVVILEEINEDRTLS